MTYALVLVLALRAGAADAQVLTIGETLGKGKSGLLISDNVIVPGDDIPNLNIAYGLLATGLHDRFDLYLSAGATTTEGTTQAFAGGGWNLRLVRLGRATVSFFNVATIPLNRRDEACQVLFNPALVVSAPLGTKCSSTRASTRSCRSATGRAGSSRRRRRRQRADWRNLRDRQMGPLGRGRLRQPQRVRRRPYAVVLRHGAYRPFMTTGASGYPYRNEAPGDSC